MSCLCDLLKKMFSYTDSKLNAPTQSLVLGNVTDGTLIFQPQPEVIDDILQYPLMICSLSCFLSSELFIVSSLFKIFFLLITGNGLGIRIVGGKEIPGSSGETGAYIAKILPGGSAEQTGKLIEGKLNALSKSGSKAEL